MNFFLRIENTSQRKDSGFTLIELMIVIAIIGILSASASFAYTRARDKARIGACKATMGNIRSSMEDYYIDNKMYPPGPYSAFQELADELSPFVRINVENSTCKWGSYETDGTYYVLTMIVTKSTGTDVTITLDTNDLTSSE